MKRLLHPIASVLVVVAVCNTVLAEEKTAKDAAYEKMLYDLGAFPVAKLTKSYWTNGNPGKVYSKGQRVDVDGWLPPDRASGYLTDAEQARYGIPKKPLTYEQYMAMLDIATYKRARNPMLFLVMRFALESMEREQVPIRKEDILRIYESRIGLEEFAVRLLRGQLSSADAVRLVRDYGDERLFDVLPAPQAADKAYVAFLIEQADAPRWSIRCRHNAYTLLFAMDEDAYCNPYRKFLLRHVQMAKDWRGRASLYEDLIRLKDAESMQAIRDALLHDPITECREAILHDLEEQGEIASVIDAILIVANGQDETHHAVTPSRMESGWNHCLTEYLKWAKSQKGLDAETSRKVDEATERLEGSETPQELIATYRHALAAEDWRKCFLCYDPKMRGDSLIRLFYTLGVSRDAELAAIVKKRLRIEFSDPERMTIPGLRRDDRVPREVLFYEAIRKRVDDLPGFVDEMCRRLDAMGQKAFSKLGDVREISIQGDNGVGYWSRSPNKSTGQPLSDNRVPVHFRKIGGKWYMAIPDPPPPLSVDDRVKLLNAEVESLFVYLCCSTAAVDPFAESSPSQTAQPSDKRYSELRLTVQPVYGGNVPTVHAAQLTAAQAKKLIEYLATEGFLQRAVELGKQEVPEHDLSENCYTLQVSTQKLQLHEDFGWGPAMLKRLQGLRGALDGDAARAMDAILTELAEDGKTWATTPKNTAPPPAHQ